MDSLFSLPESSPPPLVEARKKLRNLQYERDATLALAKEYGEQDELAECESWRSLKAQIEDHEREVRRLEEIAATEAK